MNRTIAPMSAKVFALISVILTVLALIACLGLIFLQDVLKGAFSSASEIRDIFVFPIISFLVHFLPALVMAALCVAVLADGRKPVWTKGKAMAFAAVRAIVYVLFSLLEMPAATLEAQLMARQGSYTAVTYSIVCSMLNWGYSLLRYSSIAAFVGISVLAYQAAADAKAQMPQYMGGNT